MKVRGGNGMSCEFRIMVGKVVDMKAHDWLRILGNSKNGLIRAVRSKPPGSSREWLTFSFFLFSFFGLKTSLRLYFILFIFSFHWFLVPTFIQWQACSFDDSYLCYHPHKLIHILALYVIFLIYVFFRIV